MVFTDFPPSSSSFFLHYYCYVSFSHLFDVFSCFSMFTKVYTTFASVKTTNDPSTDDPNNYFFFYILSYNIDNPDAFLIQSTASSYPIQSFPSIYNNRIF